MSGYNVGTDPGGGDPPPPNPTQAAWDVAGMWSKIEDYQHQNIVDYTRTGTASLIQTNTYKWFPVTYANNPTSPTNQESVFGQLARWIWYRGIQYTARWGKIERLPSEGGTRWDELDFVINTVRDLYAITGLDTAKNKKVIFLIPFKTFSYSLIDDLLAKDLQTTGTAYTNGTVRYDHTMAFSAGYTKPITGYVLKLQNFRDGLTGNDPNGDPIYTLRDRYYAFIQAIYNRYKDNPAFGGICTTEPTPDSSADYLDGSEYNKNNYMDGRFKLIIKFKEVFTKHLVAEAISLHNNQWSANIPKIGTQVLKDNRVAFINPNYHTGMNLDAIYGAADTLANVVTIINSCQGLDQDSKTGFYKKGGTGNPVDVYDFDENDAPTYGRPRTGIQNPNYDAAGTLISFDPPNLKWVIHRAIYLKTNILMYQHNYADSGFQGAPRYNWKDFYTAMNNNTTLLSPNTGGLIQDDPLCGMVGTRPQYIAGEP